MHHEGRQLLQQIEEGMDVYDVNGDKIGEVSDLFLGTTSDEAEAYTAGSANVPDPDVYRDDSFAEDIAEALSGRDMPKELRERLLQHGYIRIDGGLLKSDQYAMSDQISSVDSDGVRLSVTSDGLADS